MKRIVLTTGILIAVIVQVFSQTKNFIDQPYIETTAKVDTMVVPDRIYINIIIREKDTKGNTSVEELESKMESALKELGIDTQKDLTLNDLLSNFKRYFLKKKDVLKTKSYTLIVKEANTAGKVIIELEKLDISNVSVTKTEYSEIENLKMKLKAKAIIKAKKQADLLTSSLNQKTGSAIHISDFQSNQYVNALYGKVSGVQIRGTSSRNKSYSYNPPDIQFEKIKVECSINVKFKIE